MCVYMCVERPGERETRDIEELAHLNVEAQLGQHKMDKPAGERQVRVVNGGKRNIFFIHLSFNGHFSWFYVLAISNSAAVNMGM